MPKILEAVKKISLGMTRPRTTNIPRFALSELLRAHILIFHPVSERCLNYGVWCLFLLVFAKNLKVCLLRRFMKGHKGEQFFNLIRSTFQVKSSKMRRIATNAPVTWRRICSLGSTICNKASFIKVGTHHSSLFRRIEWHQPTRDFICFLILF